MGVGPKGPTRLLSWEPLRSPRGPPPQRVVRPSDRASSSSALPGRRDLAESPSPLGPQQLKASHSIATADGVDAPRMAQQWSAPTLLLSERGPAAKGTIPRSAYCKDLCGKVNRPAHTASEPQLVSQAPSQHSFFQHSSMQPQFMVPEPPQLISRAERPNCGIEGELLYVPPAAPLLQSAHRWAALTPLLPPHCCDPSAVEAPHVNASTCDPAALFEAPATSASPPRVLSARPACEQPLSRSVSALEPALFAGCSLPGPPKRPVCGTPVHRQSSAPPLSRYVTPADEVAAGFVHLSEAVVSRASVCALGAAVPCSAPLGRPRANTLFFTSTPEDVEHAVPAAIVREDPLPPGGWALKTIDEELVVRMLQASDPAKLRNLEPPRERLGTWMVWMVCRVAVNDPELTDFNFTCLSMPAPELEPRIMRTLVFALGGNTHLQRLQLSDSNLRGGAEARRLAESLRRNRTLRVLNIESNALEPADLQRIMQALESNRTLEELRCCNQFADPAGRDVFEAAEKTLQANCTLCVLGMDITERHYLDRVNRALIENFDNRRRAREERRRAQALPTPLQAFRFTKGKPCGPEEDDKENADGNIEDMRDIAAAIRGMMA